MGRCGSVCTMDRCGCVLRVDRCCTRQVEHASAGSLAGRCEGHRMEEAQARQLFAQLLDGLAYCHAQGVYHRDLRVEHILLSGRYIHMMLSGSE